MDKNGQCKSAMFKCPGFDDGHWCHHFDLGKVGNDQASAIRCTCPIRFLSIEYDIPQAYWAATVNESSKVLLNTITVANQCNPAEVNNCPNEEADNIETITETFQHSWSNVFSVGVTYSEGASVTLGAGDLAFGSTGAGLSFQDSQSPGGFVEIDQTVESLDKCIATPMTSVTCKFFFYEATIEVGYTMYWKNSPSTRGTYKARGNVIRMIAV